MVCNMTASRTRIFTVLLTLTGSYISTDMLVTAETCPELVSNQFTTFVFPKQGVQDYVELHPAQPLSLSAFTLCLRVATELPDKRDTILFSYNNGGDALSVWHEPNGILSLYLSHSEGATFYLPVLSALKTHICVTWESSTGETTFWVDGKQSLRKTYRQGHAVHPGGVVILGQDQDSLGGKFDEKQSFTGEISDVHLWNYVMSECAIMEIYKERKYKGNVIDWTANEYTVHGNVVTQK